jgi:hypothetical protein
MRVLPRLALVAAALAGAAGCKQGLGDRCQVSDDCQSGLVCSTGTNTHVCTPTSALFIDAGLPSDARIDAGGLFPDAHSPDGPAAPLPDAAPAEDAP